MQKIGEKVLDKICEDKNLAKQYRLGFHLPPINSVDHLHLHCFVEPLQSWRYSWLHYGKLFNSVDDILHKL